MGIDSDAVLSGLGLLTGGGTAVVVGKVIIDAYKERGKQKLEQDAQPVEQMTDFNTLVLNRLSQVEADNRKLAGDHVKCLEMHAEAQHKSGILEGQMLEIREEIYHLRDENFRQNAQAVHAAGRVAAEAVRTTAAIVAAGSSGDSGTKLPRVDAEHPLPVTVVDNTPATTVSTEKDTHVFESGI